ncbi:hypothetical protein [Thalassorhabdomicrobium marinisediminis]|uniref:hypothetical protein n=1 Tax=Thalassorhabdomicrobium marinisediminis TaxID=2170577 RepID=UPI001304A37E|nr:hypothetical protein [Thalassorhabdomicrobium marinisediminis]
MIQVVIIVGGALFTLSLMLPQLGVVVMILATGFTVYWLSTEGPFADDETLPVQNEQDN